MGYSVFACSWFFCVCVTCLNGPVSLCAICFYLRFFWAAGVNADCNCICCPQCGSVTLVYLVFTLGSQVPYSQFDCTWSGCKVMMIVVLKEKKNGNMILNIWGKLFTVLPNISSIFIIGYFKVSSSLGSPVSYSSVEESWYSKLQTQFIFDQSAVKWNFSVSLNGILCTDVLFTPCSSFSFRLSWGVYRNKRSAVSCSFVSWSHPHCSPDPMNKWQQQQKNILIIKWKRSI